MGCSVPVGWNVDSGSVAMYRDLCLHRLRDRFTLTLNTTDAPVLSQDLPVFFPAALANLWPTVFMHLDG